MFIQSEWKGIKRKKNNPSQLHPNASLFKGEKSSLIIYVCKDSFVSCLTEMSMDLTLEI